MNLDEKTECSFKKIEPIVSKEKMKTMQHDALDWIDTSKVSETQKNLLWSILVVEFQDQGYKIS